MLKDGEIMKGWLRIHAYAHCNDCAWTYTDIDKDGHHHKLGKEAQKHTDKTNHTVIAEIGFEKEFKQKL
jgi:hypothetical protein